jgi:hypothetical protein
MPTVIAIHLPKGAAPITPATDLSREVGQVGNQSGVSASDPNSAPNLIKAILAAAPGTPVDVASAAAISGQIHASDFPPQGGTLHVNTATGVVTPQPLGTPVPTRMLAPLIGGAAGATAGFFTRGFLGGAIGAGLGFLVGKKIGGA